MRDEKRNIALNKNIKIISGVILTLFIAIMGYMLYFQAVMAEDIAARPGNVRAAVERNRVLRGTIYDRNGTILSKSERQDNESQKRIYQGGAPFAQALGYATRSVVTGLENIMDKTLVTDEFEMNISRNNFLDVLKDPTSIIHRTKVGNNVITTLDSELQKRAYELLGDDLGSAGSIVALNPKTGEVLAMVNRPSYDPNSLDQIYEELNKKGGDEGVFVNKAARSRYAPGSTFKIITLIAALENIDGIEERIFEDQGELKVKSGKAIPNVNGNIYGRIGLEEAFSVSSNVVFGGLAIELGGDKLADVASRFGFNKELSFEGINIGNSTITPHSKNDDGLLAQTGIGQGEVGTNPLQMAMVAAAIANDGRLMSPRLINAVQRYDGTMKETYEPELYQTVANIGTAQTVKAYMKNNVDSSRSDVMNVLSGIRGAGKTGTAQDKYVLTSGEETPVINSWFVGFAPFEDPEIAIAVVVLDGGSGGGKAATIATELMKWYTENR